MIMSDICALSPEQRARVLRTFKEILADDGRVVLDMYSLSAFLQREESLVCEKNQLNGFCQRSRISGLWPVSNTTKKK